jgi:YggT family protein
MDIIIVPLLSVLGMALGLYWWAVVLYVILGWLEQFGILNRYNPVVYNINTFLFRFVEPALEVIRRFIPHMGMLDLSPLVLILIILFFERVIYQLGRRFM